jgi:hypothetical protein
MAKKDKVTELRQKSMFAAMEGLRKERGFPVPPRKAMANARRRSKNLAYPVPPYAGTGPLGLIELARWARYEWWKLGHWQKVAAPVIVLVALLTWEKENALREERWEQVEREQIRRLALEEFGMLPERPKKRKLLGIIPLPGRK